MDIKDDLPEEFSLDDIMNEFGNTDAPAPADSGSMDAILDSLSAAEEGTAVEEALILPESPTGSLPPLELTKTLPELKLDAAPTEVPASEEPTRRLEVISEAKEAEAKPEEPTTVIPAPAEEAAPAEEEKHEETPQPVPEIPVPEGAVTEGTAAETAEEAAPEEKPKSRFFQLHELKKKLVAGPEKLYYDLSEIGIGKLQMNILLNLIILGVSAAATTMYAMDLVPENRLKLVIFSQILAMLLSGLFGCYLMLDGLGDIFHGKFTVNTILAVTFGACLADAWFCVQELRIPCCAAFTLEMVAAMFARYHKRSTEMAQLDTMRKASRLTGLVKEPNYYDGKTGILRSSGDVEDFMETYKATPGPEKAQNLFVLLSLILCCGIAALAYMLHGVSLAVQVFSTSLLVAVPASFFTALTRPMALLEKRLHMVGTVICGWQGVKKLCGKAVFPLTDEDLFPKGSTKLNGVKFYSDRDPDEIVSYTASLIIHAGGGLVTVFRNLLRSRSGEVLPVANFQDYGGGGIGGEVNGEPVLMGSLNFLQDMGVEIPQGTMVNQAVYAAIDGQLCAVVAISYAKMRSAAAGLVSLCGCRRVKPLLLAGDFMLTEDFIRSKFNVSTRKVAMPDKDTRAALSKLVPSPDADVLALTTREDLVSAAYAVSGSRALRTACRLGVFIHVIGGLMGMTIMLALAYLGSVELLTPTNVLLYQLVWMVPGFLATEWTRSV